VAVLMEEADSKAITLERNADLEDEVGRLNERLQELEVSLILQIFNHPDHKLIYCKLQETFKNFYRFNLI
jgi:hypothetical protein